MNVNANATSLPDEETSAQVRARIRADGGDPRPLARDVEIDHDSIARIGAGVRVRPVSLMLVRRALGIARPANDNRARKGE